MSDETHDLEWFLIFVSVILIAIVAVDSLELRSIKAEKDKQITELKQQLKDSKVHADMKFEACMSQLRGKTP